MAHSRKLPGASERQEQGAVLDFIAHAMPGAVALHIPNETPAGDGWARRMAADGALFGAPDLFIGQEVEKPGVLRSLAADLRAIDAAIAKGRTAFKGRTATFELAARALERAALRPALTAFVEMKRPGWKPAKPGTSRAKHEKRQADARALIAAAGIPVGVATTFEEAREFLRLAGFHITARDSSL